MTSGHPKLLNSVSNFFEKLVGCKSIPDKEVLVSAGA